MKLPVAPADFRLAIVPFSNRWYSLVCYRMAISDGEEIDSLIIEVKKGHCTSYGPENAFKPKEIEFSMSSDTDTWRKIFNHELNIKDALKAKSFHLDGPKLKALSNKSGLEKSVNLMIEMQGVTL